MVLELLLCVSFIFPGHRNLLLSIALSGVPASHITREHVLSVEE